MPPGHCFGPPACLPDSPPALPATYSGAQSGLNIMEICNHNKKNGVCLNVFRFVLIKEIGMEINGNLNRHSQTVRAEDLKFDNNTKWWT